MYVNEILAPHSAVAELLPTFTNNTARRGMRDTWSATRDAGFVMRDAGPVLVHEYANT